MIAHFAKLQTPLGAIKTYPTTDLQEYRFATLGWTNISARNLWNLWSAPGFITSEERVQLDIEPFDEWEEFAVFGSHYFLLTADNSKGTGSDKVPNVLNLKSDSCPAFAPLQAELNFSENPKGQGLRRFGASLPVSISKRTVDGVGNFAGMGTMTRVNSCDLYSKKEGLFQLNSSPSARMCHTITDLGDAGAILVGGRTSPDNAVQDCWLYHKFQNLWERIDDIPQPRYRHSTVAVGNGGILVSSGRGNSQTIANHFLLWSRSLGWRLCHIEGSEPCATYGATFFRLGNLTSSSSASGILAGGISKDAILQQNLWRWELSDIESIVCFQLNTPWAVNILSSAFLTIRF